jgi:hypothetical protein
MWARKPRARFAWVPALTRTRSGGGDRYAECVYFLPFPTEMYDDARVARWYRWPEPWRTRLRHGLQLPWAGETRPAPCDVRNYDSSRCDDIYREFSRLIGFAVEGPFPESALGSDVICVSPIGGVVKVNSAGVKKVRAVVDLTRSAVNAHLAALPVHLTSVDDVMADTRQGDFLGKVDMADYFFSYQVAACDRPYLGFRNPQDNRLYRYSRLPFGLRTSPYHACALMHTACGLIRQRFAARHPGLDFGVYDYVDDVLFRAESRALCAELMDVGRGVFKQLGLTLAEHKTEGPALALTFLGLRISTTDMTLSVDEERRGAIKREVRAFISDFKSERRSRAPRRAIARLAGRLSFAAKAVRSGRAHVRSLFNALYGTGACAHFDWDQEALHDRGLSGFATVSAEMWADLGWWERCFDVWNGVSFRSQVRADTFDVELYTDASSFGFGATRYCGGAGEAAAQPTERLAGRWSPRQAARSSNWRELNTILIAARSWAPLAWRGKRVRVSSDNTTSVAVIRRGTSAEPELLRIVRELHLLEAEHGFELCARHVSGDSMIEEGTDALSRAALREATSEWRVRRPVFSALEAACGVTYDIDAFASPRGGHLVDDFCDETRSAFDFDFTGRTAWFNPPHHLIGGALRHFLRCRERDPYTTAGTFLLPDWPTAPWYRLRRFFHCVRRLPAGTRLFERRDHLSGQWRGGFLSSWPCVVWHADRLPTARASHRPAAPFFD